MNEDIYKTTLFEFQEEALPDSKMFKSELTPRQWKLYEFLKTHNGFKSQEDMLSYYEKWLYYDNLDKKYYYGYLYELENNRPFANMSSARDLREDLQVLRNDPTIQKIICQDKIAETKEEALAFIEKYKTDGLKKLKQYWNMLKKLDNHFQTRLTFNLEKDIIEAVREFE